MNLDLTLVSSSSDRTDTGHEVVHLYSGSIRVPQRHRTPRGGHPEKQFAVCPSKSSLLANRTPAIVPGLGTAIPVLSPATESLNQHTLPGAGLFAHCLWEARGPGGPCQRHVATALHPQDSPSRWQLHPSVCPGCPRSQEEVTQTLALSLQETVPCLKKKNKLYHRNYYGTKLPGIKANRSSAHSTW